MDKFTHIDCSISPKNKSHTLTQRSLTRYNIDQSTCYQNSGSTSNEIHKLSGFFLSLCFKLGEGPHKVYYNITSNLV